MTTPRRGQAPEPLVEHEWLTEPDHRGAFTGKDLRAVAWLLLERLYIGDLSSSEASAAGTLIRALTALGDSPGDEEEQLAIIALHGGLMNGIPPRDDEEWALAERIFGPESMEEFRRWKALRAER